MDRNDYCRVLGVAPDATREQITAAYRRLARVAHPDAGGDAALFAVIEEAHRMLVGSARRAEEPVAAGAATGETSTATDAGGYSGASSTTSDQATSGAATSGAGGGTTGRRCRATVYGEARAAESHGAAGQVGLEGERRVVAAIERAKLDDRTFVFHDVVLPGGSGNVDHVIVRGRHLLVLDTKTWRRGVSYRYDLEEQQAWRGGQRFKPGDLSSTRYLAGLLRQRLGWPGVWDRALVVVGPSETDLAGYRPSDFTVVTEAGLVAFLEKWQADVARANSETASVDPWALAQLYTWTSAPQVSVTSLPAAVRPIDAANYRAPSIPKMASALVWATSAVWLVAAAAVLMFATAGWFGVPSSTNLTLFFSLSGGGGLALNWLQNRTRGALHDPVGFHLRHLAGMPSGSGPFSWAPVSAAALWALLPWAGIIVGGIIEWLTDAGHVTSRVTLTVATIAASVVALAQPVLLQRRAAASVVTADEAVNVSGMWTSPVAAPLALNVLRAYGKRPTAVAFLDAVAADPANATFEAAIHR